VTKLREKLEKHYLEFEDYLFRSETSGVVLLDSELNILDHNVGFMKLFRPVKTPLGEPIANFIELGLEDIALGAELRLNCSRKTGVAGIISAHMIRIEDGYILFCERFILTESHALEQFGSMNDDLINLQRELVKKNNLLEKMKLELDSRVMELEAALARVKSLEGIIPICMFCKQIRDDSNSWHKLEVYISQHTDALFSHGVCPDCLEKNAHMFKADMK
jgi:hypothetical protein